jgi:2,5-diketo-D-gluconate reductase A
MEILRWQIELVHSVIPKSVHTGRIHENGDIFGFTLTDDEVAAINAHDRL